MKEIEIDDAIRRDPKLLAAVEHASRLLEEAIGPSAATVSAKWEQFAADQPNPSIRLRISDWTGSAMTLFQRSVLGKMTESALSLAFVRLWGDLLQERSHKQVELLNKRIQGLDDE